MAGNDEVNSRDKTCILLSELLRGIQCRIISGDIGVEVEGLSYDSREVKPGYLFIAIKGKNLDGHDFVKEAKDKGAVAVVYQYGEEMELGSHITTVKVRDSRAVLSEISARYYNHPSEEMNIVGITGTNGKTTTSYLLESILRAAGRKPGVIGTVNVRYPGKVWRASVTTPESLDLMRQLRKMSDARVSDVILEVSSHALDQGRTRDCSFNVVVFTNISRDHLDYHTSMEEYFRAKSILFRKQKKTVRPDPTIAVINLDDPRGRELVALTDFPYISYGLSEECDIRAKDVQMSRAGIKARIITPNGELKIQSPLVGNFNIYNIMAASAAAMCLGVEPSKVSSGIEQLSGVPGRLELVENSLSKTVLVDYAHTPDALLKVLSALRPFSKRIITVFGCGGDRDKGKRRQMGRVAGHNSDIVIITSDNPRTESPLAIALEIEEGVRETGMKRIDFHSEDSIRGGGYALDIDRKSAIRRAVKIADVDSVVLIAGKGHEDYQIVGKEKRNFDDRKAAFDALAGLL